MPEPSFRAAIFDFGGVMTEPILRDFSHVPDHLSGIVEFFLNEFRDTYHLSTGRHDIHLMETGQITEVEFFTRLCARYAEAGNSEIHPDDAANAVWGASMAACGAMADAVLELRRANVRTALLTNISKDGDNIIRAVLDPDDLFDVVVDSSKVGLRKPDPAIFELTAQRLGVTPADCIFVDDLECNVTSAAELGMTVIHCRNPVDAAREVLALVLGAGYTAEGEDAIAG